MPEPFPPHPFCWTSPRSRGVVNKAPSATLPCLPQSLTCCAGWYAVRKSALFWCIMDQGNKQPWPISHPPRQSASAVLWSSPKSGGRQVLNAMVFRMSRRPPRRISSSRLSALLSKHRRPNQTPKKTRRQWEQLCNCRPTFPSFLLLLRASPSQSVQRTNVPRSSAHSHV